LADDSIAAISTKPKQPKRARKSIKQDLPVTNHTTKRSKRILNHEVNATLDQSVKAEVNSEVAEQLEMSNDIEVANESRLIVGELEDLFIEPVKSICLPTNTAKQPLKGKSKVSNKCNLNPKSIAIKKRTTKAKVIKSQLNPTIASGRNKRKKCVITEQDSIAIDEELSKTKSDLDEKEKIDKNVAATIDMVVAEGKRSTNRKRKSSQSTLKESIATMQPTIETEIVEAKPKKGSKSKAKTGSVRKSAKRSPKRKETSKGKVNVNAEVVLDRPTEQQAPNDEDIRQLVNHLIDCVEQQTMQPDLGESTAIDSIPETPKVDCENTVQTSDSITSPLPASGDKDEPCSNTKDHKLTTTSSLEISPMPEIHEDQMSIDDEDKSFVYDESRFPCLTACTTQFDAISTG
jgi:hypothetical protein